MSFRVSMLIGLPRRFSLNSGYSCQTDEPPFNRVTAVTYVNSPDPVSFSTSEIKPSAHFFFTSSRNACHACL